MGNAIFRCCTTSKNDFETRPRRGFWEKILCSCGFKSPSKRKRSAIIENVSNKYQRSGSVWPSKRMDMLHSTKQTGGTIRYASRSTSTSKVSISLTQENHQESLLHTVHKGRSVPSASTSNLSVSAVSCNSPDTARKLFNDYCNYQKLHICGLSSHLSQRTNGDSRNMVRMSSNPESCHLDNPDSSPSPSPSLSPSPSPSPSDSPDLTRMPLNSYPQLPGSSPISLASPTGDALDFRRISDYQDCYKQQHVDRSTTSSSSVDAMRKSFNQQCNYQRHSAFQKKCQSTRRNNKPGSGKSSRRKRSGMRSTSQRRAVSGDNEHKSNGTGSGMGFQSRKIHDSTSLEKGFSAAVNVDNTDKSCKLRSLPDKTSRVYRSLGKALKEDNREDNCDVLQSQSHKNENVESSERTVKWRIDDNEFCGTPHPNYYGGRVAVVNVIPRTAALALIRRQTAFASWRNMNRSGEYCRRHWKPALESISEGGDWKTV